MGKRKRDAAKVETLQHADDVQLAKMVKPNGHTLPTRPETVIQVVTGSYERVLHGLTATIPSPSSAPSSSVQFADTFLFNAHASAIRCLALSPLPEPAYADSQGVFLASGGTDEKINVYSLSASAPVENEKMPSVATLAGNKISENPRNRELGSMLHHSSSITSLRFPTRSKLLSASEDNTIAISRTKDLSVVSTVKAPHPKVLGQPSGDTAPAGATPAGVNDFSVHPSMKLMVSVGKGEKCMRLWNLVTGKKAGVLNFGRDVLQNVRESKYSSGEGRRIEWSPSGDEFAVAFERGAMVFGEDSKSKCRVLPQPPTKVHQMHYIAIPGEGNVSVTLLVVSTEDGRVLFYSTDDLPRHESGGSTDHPSALDATLQAQLGGKEAGVMSRIKDFEVVQLTGQDQTAADLIVVTGCSDGSITLWEVTVADLGANSKSTTGKAGSVGRNLGKYETGSRITCLKAFQMLPGIAGDEGLSEFEGATGDEGDSDSDNESDSDGPE